MQLLSPARNTLVITGSECGVVNLTSRSNHFMPENPATDHAIDTLVYQLYGLTEEEIKIVEGS